MYGVSFEFYLIIQIWEPAKDHRQRAMSRAWWWVILLGIFFQFVGTGCIFVWVLIASWNSYPQLKWLSLQGGSNHQQECNLKTWNLKTCDKDTIQSVLPATVILYDMPAFGGLNAHLAGPVSSGFCVLDKCNCGFLPPGNSCPYSCPCLDVFPIEHNSV